MTSTQPLDCLLGRPPSLARSNRLQDLCSTDAPPTGEKSTPTAGLATPALNLCSTGDPACSTDAPSCSSDNAPAVGLQRRAATLNIERRACSTVRMGRSAFAAPVHRLAARRRPACRIEQPASNIKGWLAAPRGRGARPLQHLQPGLQRKPPALQHQRRRVRRHGSGR